MVIPPFNRNPYNAYINPYYWVDDHPLIYGNNVSLDPGTHGKEHTNQKRCLRVYQVATQIELQPVEPVFIRGIN